MLKFKIQKPKFKKAVFHAKKVDDGAGVLN